jgi:uncharacterized delta-60 repeat protein
MNDNVYSVALQTDGRMIAGGDFTTVNGVKVNRLARLNRSGTTDDSFLINAGLSGANATVLALVSQTDGRVLAGGWFTTLNGINRSYVGRLNADGSTDPSFNPGAGADNVVWCLAEAFINSNRVLYVGGTFLTFNGISSRGLVRLKDDGSVDSAFNTGAGLNGIVYGVAVYPAGTPNAGKVLAGGSFVNVNGTARANIVRLNQDGSVDPTFNPGTGASDLVRAVAIQADGRALLGGAFTSVNGAPLNRLARLNADGSVDATFLVGEGANGLVEALAIQADNRIVVVGDFTRASGVSRNRITRLMPNGKVDPTINFGTGANAFIATLALQPDGMMVLGGGFTQIQDQPRPHLARIYGGAVTGAGALEFVAADYVVDESAVSARITVQRIGGTSGPNSDGSGEVTVDFTTTPGTAVPGVNYAEVTRTLAFPMGETLQAVEVPILYDPAATADLTVHLALAGPLPPAVLGYQPTATLTIRDVTSTVSFSTDNYTRNEDAIDGAANISLVRVGDLRTPATITFLTLTNGTAIPGVNYQPVTTTVTFSPGQTNVIVKVPVIIDSSRQGNRTVMLLLTNVVGSALIPPTQATLTIIDDFSNQVPNDNFVSAVLLAGDSGSLWDNNTNATAQPGEPSHGGYPAQHSIWYQWTPTASGLAQFDTFNSAIDTVLSIYTASAGGAYLTNLNYIIANDNLNESYDMDPVMRALSQPWIGPSGLRFNARAGVTYYVAVDSATEDTGPIALNWAFRSAGVFRLSADAYACSENESAGVGDATTSWSPLGVRITATRVMGSSGRVQLQFNTVDGSAANGTNFTCPTNTLLTFDDWEMSKSFVIPVQRSFSGGFSTNIVGGSNTEFNVVLTSVAFDPLENTNLQPPRIDMAHSNSLVTILATEGPRWYGTNVGGPLVNFRRSYCRTAEWIGTANVWVSRSGGSADKAVETHYSIDSLPAISLNLQDNFFPLQAGSDYATPDPAGASPPGITPHFMPVNGTLSWGAYDFSDKVISIPIYTNPSPAFNEDLRVKLYSAGHDNDAAPGSVREMSLTILYNEYPAGALDDGYNVDFSLATNPPRNTKPGTDGTVYALAVQPDDKTIVAGHFTTYNTIGRNGIARANFDGSLDTTFNPGSGVASAQGDFISSLALDPTSGAVVLGGSFASVNGISRHNVARLLSTGALDGTFNPGLGTDGTVWAVALQPDGKVVIAGNFTKVNNVNRGHLARLNPDGSLDASFDPGTNAPNAAVHALAIQPNGAILVGGDFTAAGPYVRKGIARFGTGGAVDAGFDPGQGVDGPVYAIAVQLDGRILIGGAFAHVGVYERNNLARLTATGAVDTSFEISTGADDTVYSITLPTDGTIYLGGLFTSINGTRRVGAARLLATGEVDTSWLDMAYNQFAGPHKAYFNPNVNPKDFLFATALQSDGNLVIGGSFAYVGGGRLSALSQTNAVEPVDLIQGSGDSGMSRATFRPRANVARLLGGSTMGPGSMRLATTNYAANETMSFLYVKLVREHGTLGQIQANFNLPSRPPGPGVAQSGVDYLFNRVSAPVYISSWNATRMFSDGVYGTNNVDNVVIPGYVYSNPDDDVYVSVMHRPGIQGDRSVPFQLSVPSCNDVFYLGGEDIPLASALGAATATLNIFENDVNAGAIGFSALTYFVNKNGTNAVVTLTRTNGSTGVVTVLFATADGLPPDAAISGADFVGITNTVTFQDGELIKTVSVPVIGSQIVTPDKNLLLTLSSPGNGAALSLSNALLYIVDDNSSGGHINFTPTAYSSPKSAASVALTVTRMGGALGTIDVLYATTNGPGPTDAQAGVHYGAVSNLLHWDSGDITPRTIAVPLLQDGLVNPDLTFNVLLSNPKWIGTNYAAVLGSRTNATVTLVNDSFYGTFQFLTTNYFVNEQGSYAWVTVVRTNGTAQAVTVYYTTYDLTAVAGYNYAATSGQLVFENGVLSQSFTVPILYQPSKDGLGPYHSMDFGLVLTPAPFPSGATVGPWNPAVVHVIDLESVNAPPGAIDVTFNPATGLNGDVYSLALQSDGKIVAGGAFTKANSSDYGRLVRFQSDGSLDAGFLLGLAGANATVRAVLSQTDSRVLVGGAFTTLDSVNRNSVGRLNYDGSLDTSFNPGSGADGSVFALAETFVSSNRFLFVGGAFNTFNGVASAGVVRLNDDGTVDTSFNLTAGGANGSVFAVAPYPVGTPLAGKVLIGGSFTTVNGLARTNLARLNADGSVDTTFNPAAGASDTVRSLVIQTDGRLLVGGAFTNLNGVALNRLGRLNADGTLDGAFAVGLGADDTVEALAVQPDSRILVVGDFTSASGVSRNRITRLMPDGTVDPTINFGSGANGMIAAVAVQPDNQILIGGGFTGVQEEVRNHFARLNGGAVTNSGAFEFTAASFAASESGGHARIGVRRTGGTSGPNPDGSGSVSVQFATSAGTAVAEVNYTNVTQTLTFPMGETFQTVLVPVVDDGQITPELTVNLTLTDPSSPAILGFQPTALLTILNVDSAVSFSAATYARREDAIDHAASITLVRAGNVSNPAAVDFMTTTNGTAGAGTNYLAQTNTVTFLPGETNVVVKVTLLNDPTVQGDLTVDLVLLNPVGTLLLPPTGATLTIEDASAGPGQLAFATTNYSALEGQSAVVSVIRTNGRTGVVSVRFLTQPDTAVPAVDYVATNGVLTFADGETNKTFVVSTLDDGVVTSDKSLWLILTNVTGGASLGSPAAVPMVVAENDSGFVLGSPVYVASENAGTLVVTVRRLGSSNDTMAVTFGTTTNGITNNVAINGVDYTNTPSTNVFLPGETFKNFTLQVFPRPGLQGDRSFNVALSYPTNLTHTNLTASLGQPEKATVFILDSDTGFSFTNATFSVLKDGTNLLVTVVRTNPNTGSATVFYATQDGTAKAGQNYQPVVGTLVFNNGDVYQGFTCRFWPTTWSRATRPSVSSSPTPSPAPMPSSWPPATPSSPLSITTPACTSLPPTTWPARTASAPPLPWCGTTIPTAPCRWPIGLPMAPPPPGSTTRRFPAR